jgi:glyoxylase-like metal-dependent hydrolase (beta-lactamase superfamily II)
MQMTSSPLIAQYQTSTGTRIYRLPVEAFPNMWANTYLVKTGDELSLIDTGSGSEKSNADLAAGFAQAGFRFDDLSRILLTHGHIDHFGGLVYLREHTDAPIGVHELDLQTVARHEERLALMTRRVKAFLSQAGVPDEHCDELIQMYRFTKLLYHSVPVDFTYEANDMQIGHFEMIHLPGHCPGHVAIKLDDVVFSGDLVLERIIPHQSPEELTPYMGLRHYLESLTALKHWSEGASLVLNGHDDPITDLPGRITDIRQHMSGRIRQTLDALSEPRTIAEVTQQVYGQMGGYNSLLVLEKIGAYIENLYQRGLLEITNLDEFDNGQPAAVRYRRLHEVNDSEILPKEKRYVFV